MVEMYVLYNYHDVIEFVKRDITMIVINAFCSKYVKSAGIASIQKQINPNHFIIKDSFLSPTLCTQGC